MVEYTTRRYELTTFVPSGSSIASYRFPTIVENNKRLIPVSYVIEAVWFKTYPDTTLTYFEIYDKNPLNADIRNLLYRVESANEWYEPLSGSEIRGAGDKMYFRVDPTTSAVHIRLLVQVVYEVREVG